MFHKMSISHVTAHSGNRSFFVENHDVVPPARHPGEQVLLSEYYLLNCYRFTVRTQSSKAVIGKLEENHQGKSQIAKKSKLRYKIIFVLARLGGAGKDDVNFAKLHKKLIWTSSKVSMRAHTLAPTLMVIWQWLMFLDIGFVGRRQDSLIRHSPLQWYTEIGILPRVSYRPNEAPSAVSKQTTLADRSLPMDKLNLAEGMLATPPEFPEHTTPKLQYLNYNMVFGANMGRAICYSVWNFSNVPRIFVCLVVMCGAVAGTFLNIWKVPAVLFEFHRSWKIKIPHSLVTPRMVTSKQYASMMLARSLENSFPHIIWTKFLFFNLGKWKVIIISIKHTTDYGNRVLFPVRIKTILHI